jgi:hypothetical protein
MRFFVTGRGLAVLDTYAQLLHWELRFFVGRAVRVSVPSPGTASQAREPDSPSGSRAKPAVDPLPHPVSNSSPALPITPTLATSPSKTGLLVRQHRAGSRRLTSVLRRSAPRSQIEHHILSFHIGS